MRIFLGGTCNNSEWRDKITPNLKCGYFNPVVKDWNDEAYNKELYERATCDYVLYVITPKMTGVYSIAEVVDDSNKRPNKTIFSFLSEDGSEKFIDSQTKSLESTGKMISKNGATYLNVAKLSYDEAISTITTYLNTLS